MERSNMRWMTGLLAAVALAIGCGDGGGSNGDATPTTGAATGGDDSDGTADGGPGSADDEADDGTVDDTGPGDTGDDGASWPQYDENPFVFDLDFPVPTSMSRGSIFVHEIDGDGLFDFVVTGIDNIAVYDHFGVLMWHDTPPIHLPESANGGFGYPGLFAPGAIAGDIDDDGEVEIAYITWDGVIRIHDGRTGVLENAGQEAAYTFVGGLALAIANLRGLGDRDAVVQYSQWELRAIALDTGQTLWHTTDWYGIEHSMVRVVDVDGDGRDDVVGPIFLGPDGQRKNGWDLEQDQGTLLAGLDSLGIGDIVPGMPLEIALAETAPDKTGIALQSGEAIVVNHDAILWGTTRWPGDIPNTYQCEREKDPDKIAVGDFDPTRAGLEVFARSACGHHPWVMDATGEIVATWNVMDTAPPGWNLGDPNVPDSEGGIDTVSPIQWDAGGGQFALLRERDLDGKAAIVDAMTGQFLVVWELAAARSYAADISGDYREEAIIVESSASGNGRVKVFWNDAPNPDPTGQPRRWTMQDYRRIKQNWNYYSP